MCDLLMCFSISFGVGLMIHTSKGYNFTIGCVQDTNFTSGLFIGGSCFISASTLSNCAALPADALALGVLDDLGTGVVPVNNTCQ